MTTYCFTCESFTCNCDSGATPASEAPPAVLPPPDRRGPMDRGTQPAWIAAEIAKADRKFRMSGVIESTPVQRADGVGRFA
jgi:hypothetical protein